MSKRKKISAAKRSAKRARVQVNRSDGERDLVSEPEEGMSFFVPYFLCKYPPGWTLFLQTQGDDDAGNAGCFRERFPGRWLWVGMLNLIFFPKSKLGSKKSIKNQNSNSVCPMFVKLVLTISDGRFRNFYTRFDSNYERFLPSISAVTVSIFGFAVGFGRFLNKNCGSQSVLVLSFYGSRFWSRAQQTLTILAKTLHAAVQNSDLRLSWRSRCNGELI